MKKSGGVLLISIFCFSVHGQFVSNHGQLKVAGTKLVDANGKPLTLRGMSFGWHNLWPRFYNAGAVQELVTIWNSNVIRAAMGIELNDKGYLKSPETSIRVMKNVIEACIKEDVYVIIDWHDHNIHQKEAIGFFDLMSKEYGRFPNVIYEIFNEPDYETWPEVKAYLEAVITTIRANDPDNIILVGSPKWDQDIQLPAAEPITGFDNLMYTLHFYAATHSQWLRDRTDEALQNGLPIFISESAGMAATGDGPLDYEEWKKWIEWMESKGLSWVTWSVSDKNETCSVLKPSAASDGGWKDSDIKESGLKIKEYLKKYSSAK